MTISGTAGGTGAEENDQQHPQKKITMAAFSIQKPNDRTQY